MAGHISAYSVFLIALCAVSAANAVQCRSWTRDDVRTIAAFQSDLQRCALIKPAHPKDYAVLERISACDFEASQRARGNLCIPALKEAWRVLGFLINERRKLDSLVAQGQISWGEHGRLTALIHERQLDELRSYQLLAHRQLDEIDAAGAAAVARHTAHQKIYEAFGVLKPSNSAPINDPWIQVVDNQGRPVGRIDNTGGFNRQGNFYLNDGRQIGKVDTGGGFNSHGSVYDLNGLYLGRISPN